MSQEVLTQDVGPRAARRLRFASALFALAILVGLYFVGKGLASNHEFDPDRWATYGTWSGWRFLLAGLWNTVRVALVDGAVALALGMAIALGQLSSRRPVRGPCVLYAEFFRSLPTLLLILFCYFGLPYLGFDIGPFWAIVVGSAAYNSAVLSNIFRAGIGSIDRGQFEAGYSLGVTHRVVMRRVIWPQAVRRMLPSVMAQFVVLFKDSALGFFIGYEELLRRSQEIGTYSHNFLQAYLVVGLIYVLICYALRRLAMRLGRWERGPMV